MTYAEAVAKEHIAHRRDSGWTWLAIRREAMACLRTMGLPVPTDMRADWEVERALATVYAAMQRLKVAA